MNNDIYHFIYGFDKFDESLPLDQRFNGITFKNQRGVSFELGRLNEGKLVRLQSGATFTRNYTGYSGGNSRISFAIRVNDVSNDTQVLTITANAQLSVIIAIDNGRWTYKYKPSPSSDMKFIDMRAAYADEWVYIELSTRFYCQSDNMAQHRYTNASINGVTYANFYAMYIPDPISSDDVAASIEVGDINNNVIVDVDDMYFSNHYGMSGDGGVRDLFVSAKMRDVQFETVEGETTSVVGASNALDAINDASSGSYVNLTKPVSFTSKILSADNERPPYMILSEFDVRTLGQGICDFSIEYKEKLDSYWKNYTSDRFMPGPTFENYQFEITRNPIQIKFSFK